MSRKLRPLEARLDTFFATTGKVGAWDGLRVLGRTADGQPVVGTTGHTLFVLGASNLGRLPARAATWSVYREGSRPELGPNRRPPRLRPCGCAFSEDTRSVRWENGLGLGGVVWWAALWTRENLCNAGPTKTKGGTPLSVNRRPPPR